MANTTLPADAPTATPKGDWPIALDRFRAAQAGVAEACASSTDDTIAQACQVFGKAQAAIFSTDAPDLAALTIKLESLADDLENNEPDMDFVRACVADARRLSVRGVDGIANALLIGGGTLTSDWIQALADYQTARAISDACPAEHPDEDRLLDAYCAAMDTALVHTPAPSWTAVIQKMDWAVERQRGFGFVPEYADAIRADVVRLAKLEG